MPTVDRISVHPVSDFPRTRNDRGRGVLLDKLYAKPLLSTRTGPLYNAFPYPTKISPESVAVFIACHTKPGDVVLDTFAGIGSTGLAALLCDRPTAEMKRIATDLKVSPSWGPRHAVLYELGVVGAFVSRAMCNPPDPQEFEAAALQLLTVAKSDCTHLYESQDPDGMPGEIRHVIWTDCIICPHCAKESRFWDVAVKKDPLRLADVFVCPGCKDRAPMDRLERATEKVFDPLLGRRISRKKRLPARIHGRTGGSNWMRPANAADLALFKKIEAMPIPPGVPIREMRWGELHRAGYHAGISHVHHFYTHRNLIALSTLWNRINAFPATIQDTLRLLVLSYNATHSTLMTRVVIKDGQKDFILTGAQSGVLYVSSLPVEKNVFEGVRRKIGTFTDAFTSVYGSRSKVSVYQGSSTKLCLSDASVDYVFTDPPFGDYIPYAEINQISEAWLGKMTDRRQEIIISPSQKKSVEDYRAMLSRVFQELNRVLRRTAKATVVFHSAKVSVWRALMEAYSKSGFAVTASSVLDKVQTSFKQTASRVSVKGDPLLLLSRDTERKNCSLANSADQGERIIGRLLAEADRNQLDPKERTTERLYSRYVARCLERGISVTVGAEPFYNRVRAARKLG
jgi:hypothetical protein